MESDLDLASPEAALGGLVLLIGGLALAPLAIVLARRISPGRNVFFARWGFSHVALTIVFGIGVSVVVGSMVAALPTEDSPKVLVDLAATALTMGGVALLIAAFARRLDPDGVRCLGLRAGGNLRACFAGGMSYLLLLPGILGVGLAWPWAMEILELEYQPQAVALGLMELSAEELWIAAIFAVGLVPFLEEVLFRGFLQPLLVQNLGDRGGVAATSTVFGLLHGASAFLPIFALSLVIGSVMLRSQRLAASWLVHALHNGLMLALLVLVPETRELLGQETVSP